MTSSTSSGSSRPSPATAVQKKSKKERLAKALQENIQRRKAASTPSSPKQ